LHNNEVSNKSMDQAVQIDQVVGQTSTIGSRTIPATACSW
jgi:hypothetical protein